MSAAQIPCCLTVAGSDSGGNAGVQADLRTFNSYGVHGCAAIAALTAQNPSGVFAVHLPPAGFVAAQIDAVAGAYRPAAAKTGMLGGADAVEAVASRLAAMPAAKVVDPVMVATSGAALADRDAVEAAERLLLPIATVVTPNIPEAETLCGLQRGARAADAAFAEELARRIADRFGCAALVKGGHGAEREAVDVLATPGGAVRRFSAPWIENPASTHGTGCTLSAAIAAELALGRALEDAIAGAKRHTRAAIAGSCRVSPTCASLAFVRQPAT